MKRILAVSLALVLLCSCALAEIDLSSYSFEELAALRDQCQLEMMKRDAWQEVTVPQGLWEVGVHIPAGTWVIRCADIGRDSYLLAECDIRWGKGKPNNDNFWDYSNNKGEAEIFNPNNENYEGQTSEYIVELAAGDFIFIEPEYNKAVFTPYTGAPSFGFK